MNGGNVSIPYSPSILNSVSIPLTLSPSLSVYTKPHTGLLPVYSPTYSDLTLTPTHIVTPLGSRLSLLAVKPSLYVDIDTGLHDSYVIQKDVTKYFMYKALDKWLYSDYKSVLGYLVYKNGKVELVKKIEDKSESNVTKDSLDVLEAKSDYIGEHILTEMNTRSILIRIMKELGFKWFDLPHRENLVNEVIGKYIRRKIKKMILGEDNDDSLLNGGFQRPVVLKTAPSITR